MVGRRVRRSRDVPRDEHGDGVDVVLDGIRDADPAAPVVCTLRAADPGSQNTGAADTITINIGGMGPHTITPTLALPNIVRPVTIDGTAEPDYATLGYPAIELDGTSAGDDVHGLVLAAGSGNSSHPGARHQPLGGRHRLRHPDRRQRLQHDREVPPRVDPKGTVDLGNTEHGIAMLIGANDNTSAASSARPAT